MANIVRLNAFVELPDTITILIESVKGLQLHLEHDDEQRCFQVSYRLSGRRHRSNAREWIAAIQGSRNCARLRPILPKQQYQILILCVDSSNVRFKQLFHFNSPLELMADAKVRIFNSTPSNYSQTAGLPQQDVFLVNNIVAVLLKEAYSNLEQCACSSDAFSIESSILKWGTTLLEKVVHNDELGEKKSIVVCAIIQSMMKTLEQHSKKVLKSQELLNKSNLQQQLQAIYDKCFKAVHKRSGRASHVLRMLKHLAFRHP